MSIEGQTRLSRCRKGIDYVENAGLPLGQVRVIFGP